jgi:hypothetical protein
MKTPVNLVAKAIALWVTVLSIVQLPVFIDNDVARIALLSVVIPNLLRYIVGNIPRLAVDRKFMAATTIISFAIILVINRFSSAIRDRIKDYGKDKVKSLQVSLLILLTFVSGALLTYYTNIDGTLYTDMGWETNMAAPIQPIATGQLNAGPMI